MKRERGYRLTVERIFERLTIEKRPEKEQVRIKQIVYEALAKEALAFIWDSLDSLKRLAFKADLDATKGDLKEINNVIYSYYQIIPDHSFRLEQRLQAFEATFYAKIIILQKQKAK